LTKIAYKLFMVIHGIYADAFHFNIHNMSRYKNMVTITGKLGEWLIPGSHHCMPS